MATYRVDAPYVTFKVRDQAGAWVLTGYYAGAVVAGETVEPDSLRHHVDGGMVAEVENAAVPAAAEPTPEPAAGDVPPRPHGNASAATWLEYAVSRRAEDVSEEDARKALEGKSKAELVAEYGG
jgi:hypothetical protein